jgi:hypothetical protein
MTRTPPRAAIRLLHYSEVSNWNEALVGDILEEYESGRSATWFLWQTLVVLAVYIRTTLRTHWGLAIRAVLIGLVTAMTLRLVREQMAELGIGADPVLFWVFNCLSFTFAGWVVASTHPGHRLPMVLAFTLYTMTYKVWMISTHFQDYWNPARPLECVRDIALTGLTLLCCLAGGFLRVPKSIRS